MKDDLRYTPSDCFETFPFPEAWEASSNLETVGQSCHDFRVDLMGRHGEGLTRIYNRFHDPHENTPDVVTLRSRWPDEIRDEVLARLLELNAHRAAEDARSGKLAMAAGRKTERPSTSTIERRASVARAAEPHPLWGTSND